MNNIKKGFQSFKNSIKNANTPSILKRSSSLIKRTSSSIKKTSSSVLKRSSSLTKESSTKKKKYPKYQTITEQLEEINNLFFRLNIEKMHSKILHDPISLETLINYHGKKISSCLKSSIHKNYSKSQNNVTFFKIHVYDTYSHDEYDRHNPDFIIDSDDDDDENIRMHPKYKIHLEDDDQNSYNHLVWYFVIKKNKRKKYVYSRDRWEITNIFDDMFTQNLYNSGIKVVYKNYED